MAPALSRTRFPGPVTAPALVQLLSRLVEQDGAATKPAFAERLGQWLHWTDAVALSAALDAGALPPDATPASPAAADQRDLARLRDSLLKGIDDAIDDDSGAAPPEGFAPLRRRCTALQQSIASRIAPLRARLRATLGGHSPDLARLAALDAVMEDVLGRQEQVLLASVPGLLERRFERLRDGADPAWWPLFCHDLREVLRAELDLRLQPLEGLAAALRTSSCQRLHPSPP